MNDLIVAQNLPVVFPKFRTEVINAQNYIEEEIKSGRIESLKDQCVIKHYAIPGGVAREMFTPAGTFIIGNIHKIPLINVISKGHFQVITEWGINEYKAPYTFVSPKGTKRVITAIEDSIWTCFIPTTETDMDKLDAVFTVKTYEEL